MSVTVRARLPKSDQNGLAHLEGQLADDPDKVFVVVGLLRADTVEARPHDEDDPRLVKSVLLHVEAVTEQLESARVDKVLRAIYEARTGKKELPFEGDDDEDGE